MKSIATTAQLIILFLCVGCFHPDGVFVQDRFSGNSEEKIKRLVVQDDGVSFHLTGSEIRALKSNWGSFDSVDASTEARENGKNMFCLIEFDDVVLNFECVLFDLKGIKAMYFSIPEFHTHTSGDMNLGVRLDAFFSQSRLDEFSKVFGMPSE